MSKLNPEALKKSVSIDIGGRTMTFETGWLAKQAAGAVMVTYGDSAVLVTCQDAPPRPGMDFFPMTIEYKEKTGAAGKIPGGFFKREGRPTNKEILTCRMIDRPLRPMFADGYMEDVQIIGTVFAADLDHDPDVCGMNGASMSVVLAGLPFHGPVGAVRVCRVDGELIANPTYDEREEAELELIMAGTKEAVTMVEAGADEATDEEMLEALSFGHNIIKQICEAQEKLAAMCGAKQKDWTPPEGPSAETLAKCREFFPSFVKAVKTLNKSERKAAISAAKEAALAALLPPAPAKDADEEVVAAYTKQVGHIKSTIKSYGYEAIRHVIVEENVRIDGRRTDEVRDIVCQVQPFKRLHGSAIFTRGETQAFVNATLGTSQDTQLVDGLTESYEESFLLHYNFPPFCTGEAKPLRGTSRREIGHGSLAERAIRPMLPPEDDFPYTIRVVSDVLESNGSSSMATVCGGSLALFDAGVPMSAPVAGIAMGLIKEGDTVRILSDILGDEDHCGDMDFKVCGTEKGITALQMDIKITGLSQKIMADALGQAAAGRKHILGIMNAAMPEPRSTISEYAPRYETCKVPTDKIGLVIGPGGKMIRGIQEETKTTISIEDDGVVKIFSTDGAGALRAKEIIENMTKEVELNSYVQGRITSLKDFGVFAEIEGRPGTEGMCHVSEISDQYVGDVSEAAEMNQEMTFKVIAIDPVTGKIKLSRKAVILEERGEEYVMREQAPRGDRGGRGGDRGGRGGDRGGRGGDRGGRGPRRD